MGKETLRDKIYKIIAHIGWKLFLFGSELTEDEYLKQIKEQ